MKKHLFSFLIILSIFSVLAQERKKKSYSKSSYSNKRVKLVSSTYYLTKASSIQQKSPTKAIEYVKEALEISVQEKNEKDQGKAYELLGKINFSLKQWTLALENYQQAVEHYQKGGFVSENHRLHKEIGMCYEVQKEYKKALNEYTLYKKYFPKQPKEINKKIANIYFLEEEYEKALDLYQQVLKVEEAEESYLGISDTKAQIANIYLAMNQPKKAQSLYEESDKFNEQAIQTQGKQSYSIQDAIQSNKSLNTTQQKIGKMYRDNQQYEDELILRKKAIQRGKRYNDYKKVSQEEIEISNIYIEQGFNNKAIKQLNNTISKVDTLIAVREEKAIAYKTLSKAYNEEKKYEEALIAYQKYVAEQEKILKEKEAAFANLSEALTIQKKLYAIQKDFQIQEKTIGLLQQEKQLQQADLRNQQWLIYGLLLIIFVILIATFFIYKNAKSRRIANQLLALKSLRSQMNPHFIFNALNSVNQFIAKNDERTANRFLSDFSRLMRLVLENSQKDFVSLSKEINIIQLYIKLEHNRFRDQFEYTLDIDESIDADDIEIPPMLIQPYIENAVWHGLRYKETFGMLKIELKKINDNIHIIIEDNGIGRKQSQLLKTKHQQKSESTGVKNTQNRLQIINKVYKKKFQLYISDLETDQTGTRVELYFPYME